MYDQIQVPFMGTSGGMFKHLKWNISKPSMRTVCLGRVCREVELSREGLVRERRTVEALVVNLE